MVNTELDAMLNEIGPELKALRESLLKYGWGNESGVIKALNYIEVRTTTAVSSVTGLEYAQVIVEADKAENY